VEPTRSPEAAPAGSLGTIAEQADENRRELAAEWLTAAQASRLLGSQADNSSEMATELRRAGQLVGVWVPYEHAYRYPPWQFDDNGRPVAQVQAILKLLRENGGVTDGGKRTSGWNEVEWLLCHLVLLNDRTPAAMLRDDPDRVVAAAHKEFVEDRSSF
jgi:hypothetical protein